MRFLLAAVFLGACGPIVLGGGGCFEARGSATFYRGPASDTQRKALARDAALVDAREKLLAIARAAELEDGRRLGAALDGAGAEKLRSLVESAPAVKTEFGDKDCMVTLRLPKERVEDALGVGLKTSSAAGTR
jgi:hypothetical protein